MTSSDYTEKVNRAFEEVEEELTRATQLYGPMKSYHEGLAIIEEEFEELKREVFKHKPSSPSPDLHKEAKQLAAMAIRFMIDVA